MDFSESDIWWLICCKKRNFPDSKVFIYKPDKDYSDEQRIMLKTYNIEIMNNIPFEDDYQKYYINVVNDITERLG